LPILVLDLRPTGALGPQTTAAGYLLATAVATLPTQRVAAVLASGWDTWTSGHAANAQLADALGIAMPPIPTGLVGTRGQVITPPPGTVPSHPQCPDVNIAPRHLTRTR
jgi:hypothetical protein